MSSDSVKNLPVQKKNRLNHFALAIVLIGSSVAIWAVYYRFLTDGVFSTTTFFAAIIALLAAIPVFRGSHHIQATLDN